jgi:FkbM family methyltransferase
MKSALDARVAAAFPILQTIEWTLPQEADGFWFNALTARTRQSYMPPHWFDVVNWISVNEQMFEWVTIAETILMAGDQYVMADLGAGYGRWLVNAALLARRLGRASFVIGVEAEDMHFGWMEEHLADNQISLAERRLFHAPVTGERQDVAFTFGHSKDWYGQAVLPSREADFGRWPNAQVETRRSIVLEDIIGDVPVVDLLDLDIQGMEAEVVTSSIELIGRCVKRLHIGTHSREIEDTLRRLMTVAGWYPRFDYPCATSNYPTPAGPGNFEDGVQSWINPRFA